MTSQLTRILSLSALLAPAMANAMGLGEITLQSRLGEALRAEIPILSRNEDAPIAACFSLIALRNADFPVVTSAKPRLIRRDQGYVLQLVGSKPINEPIFAIGLRAACGYDIDREYVLMPEAPMTLAQAPEAPPAPAAKRSKRPSQWFAQEGETLEDIADAQEPTTPEKRQQILDGLQKANPGLAPDQPLAEGTRVRMPQRRPATQPAVEVAAQLPFDPPAPPARKARPTPAPAPSNAKSPPADRLVLGAPIEEVPASKQARSTQASLAETDERLLKLETTLHQLTQEVAKLDQAIDLASKVIEAQNQLQLAQSVNAPPAAGPSIQASPSLTQLPRANWPELAISATLGAVVSFGMAQFIGRRRRYPGDGEVPLAFAGYRAEVKPQKTTAEPAMPMPSQPHVAKKHPSVDEDDFPVPRLPDSPPAPAQEPEVIEIRQDDESSVLALAEIMLSFGRLNGATETLAEHIAEAMPSSIAPWSMLLDLYRRGGMQSEFEALAKQIHARFNVEVSNWSMSTTPISGLKTLENYPHIVEKASQLWGTQRGIDYLHSLVHDTRAGMRTGFPLEVVEEIVLLMGIQEEAYGLHR